MGVEYPNHLHRLWARNDWRYCSWLHGTYSLPYLNPILVYGHLTVWVLINSRGGKRRDYLMITEAQVNLQVRLILLTNQAFHIARNMLEFLMN